MIFKLLPLLLLLFLLYRAYNNIAKETPEKRKGLIIKYCVYGVVAILLLAVLTGRIHWLGAVVAAGLGLLKIGTSTLLRFMPFLAVLRKNNVFGDPVFKTEHIELRINIQTGHVSGEILSGDFSGRSFDSLDNDDFNTIESLLQQQDKRSYYLFKIARNRIQGHTQKGNFDYQQDSILSEPSIEEAVLILGLPKEYTRKDIQQAHKQLIQKLHPDRGGNDYLASRINLARDILIKHINN